jgi:hypothetical protein
MDDLCPNTSKHCYPILIPNWLFEEIKYIWHQDADAPYDTKLFHITICLCNCATSDICAPGYGIERAPPPMLILTDPPSHNDNLDGLTKANQAQKILNQVKDDTVEIKGSMLIGFFLGLEDINESDPASSKSEFDMKSTHGVSMFDTQRAAA